MAGVLLITSATAAGTGTFVLFQNEVPARIRAVGLAAGESVSVKDTIDETNYNDLYESGSQVTLTSVWNSRPINGPGRYQVSKGITAGAVGVYLLKGNNPHQL